MARALPLSDMQELAFEPQPGEWQALRGELVALLDQVEGRFAQASAPKTAYDGLSQRVRNLRDQVDGTASSARHREALRTVKRAVDRFSDRDEANFDADSQDNLQSAIAEIRNRQFAAPTNVVAHDRIAVPQFGELTALVGGLSNRLERLESELKSQRASNGNVKEVASQVEQLAHVVELLAGAVGETGQVKRLEGQIAGLARLIGETPKVDLSTINRRLDDVSATVGKLAELQAEQMEREIVRQDRAQTLSSVSGTQDADVVESMNAIEHSVRNVYDRIDSIERNVALSSGEFERLTAEMAAFTQAVRDKEAVPSKLVAKIDALQARIGGFETSNQDVAGLKSDISALREVVLAGVEPRFFKIEAQLEALSVKLDQPRHEDRNVGEIENQLKLLVARMDETGAQLNGLTKLYATENEVTPGPDFEALATIVAQRTYDAGKKSTPAVAAGISEDHMNALEHRMSALFNTAGRDTAERLSRLELALTKRQAETSAGVDRHHEPAAPPPPAPVKRDARPKAEAVPSTQVAPQSDFMPANPADEAPLRDLPFQEPAASAPVARRAHPGLTSAQPPIDTPKSPALAVPVAFDPDAVQRPPRPQSSFDTPSADPFSAPPVGKPSVPEPSIAVGPQSTSTFVAAARRAQRSKQDAAPLTGSNSIIGRALARVMPSSTSADEQKIDSTSAAGETKPARASIFARRPKVAKAPKPVKPTTEPAIAAPIAGVTPEDGEPRPSFLVRYRRPLLLAATLAVVSVLALNLVMQRAASSAPVVEPVASETPSQQTSMLGQPIDPATLPTDPRAMALVDPATVGAISPTMTTQFSKPATMAMPPLPSAPESDLAAAVSADTARSAALPGSTGAAPSVGATTFDLAPEAVGPLDLRQAAADGDARAQFEIGAIYSEGRAVTQDYKSAAIWYERAAAQGFAPAAYRMGNLYETGNGIEKDPDMARLWYQRSADAGNRMAMHNLAALFAGGQLGQQEFESAAEWFEQAANRGMTDSQFNLGMLHARGLGVSQDMEQSYKWFSLAARNGDADAIKARDDVAKSLNADAVKRINAEIESWKAIPIDLAANFAPLGTWSKNFDPGVVITAKDVISKVQTVLSKLGYDVGTPDGIIGPKTAEAIKAFERGTGMSELGMINPRLLAVLGSQPV